MIIIKIINVVYPIMFFLRRQVKKCKIHKKLKLRMDWLNLTILAVFINPIMCYDLEK